MSLSKEPISVLHIPCLPTAYHPGQFATQRWRPPYQSSHGAAREHMINETRGSGCPLGQGDEMTKDDRLSK